MAPNRHANTKPARRDAPRGRLVVQLPRRPANYVSGSGPPLQSVHLALPRDSTAYILDRILLPSPGPAKDGKPLPKRMTYIVAWHDLPAARALVPAMRILEYVSQPAVEEWEFELERELDEERERLRRKPSAVPAASQSKTGKLKRGRPPAHSKIEGPVDLVEETTHNSEKEKRRRKAGAMSLSTPQKSKLIGFEGLSDEEPSPSCQVEKEKLQRATTQAGDQVKDEEEQGMDLDAPDDTTKELDHTRRIPEPVEKPLSSPNKNSENRHEFSLLFPNKLQRQPSESYILPIDSSTRQPLQRTPLSTWRPTNSKSPVSYSELPELRPSREPGHPRQYSHDTLHVSQPGSLPGTGQTQPTNGSGERPPKKSTTSQPKQTPVPPPAIPSQRMAPLPKTEGSPNEATWEVKRLEGDNLFEVEGQGLVRYFKVRWEGDWPPDQNPSWEPEENIPATLIRQYLRKAGKKKKATPRKRTSTQTTIPWAFERKYSSVSEAVAAPDAMNHMDKVDELADGSGPNGHREVFVVDGNS
ncbi:hypothetical protein S40285_03192 [Stachybotrys chlorohalonatus IBT 40285]|uniref:Chromo domain-containing protein n=1 Tax=Stachybotrys chlorohalonatus (strain IBT 40285) TaxID=1283841 RepID=A0A084QI35_STAC4|nr:hypothetical protein S40285_03192 [Stachybotrys chlorohalonata IBT 40285]